MRKRTAALVTAAALATLVTFPLSARSDDAVAFVITDPADLIGGYLADGQVGDLMLANGEISVVIEAVDHPHGDGLSGGNILDAAVAPYWVDEFGDHLTLLEDYPRQAAYDTVYVEHDGSGGTAVVVARGADSGNAAIDVTTRYSLLPDVRYVEIVTTLENTGAQVTGYSAGDALGWGDGTHFVPGYGFEVTGMTTYSAWLGSAGSTTCYGYARTGGTITATHGDLWTDPVVWSGTLPAGGSVSFTRYFIVGGLGLASVSDVAHELQGANTGTVTGTITDADTGFPVAGATVTCDVGGTSTYTRARSDSFGVYSATLYQGNYVFSVSVPSYLGDEAAASIAASQVTVVDFELTPGVVNEYTADTLTVVTRPIMSIPTMLEAGDTFTIEAEAPLGTTGWAASLVRGGIEVPLAVPAAEYRTTHERWFIDAVVPSNTQPELYDLVVTASDSIYDKVDHSVAVKSEVPTDFYFIHITDTHMPTHKFYHEEGAESDTTELDDMRAVIRDINLINPAFVLLTGDVVNEGELEEFLNWRSFTKVKRILHELEVPIYIVAGNHDVGGWESTPPPDGTARRNWWRFFGWRRLYDPPAGDYMFTQNYSFDYGGAHFVGLEAYDNYDNWRSTIYGRESFTGRQITWMANDIATTDPTTPSIVFYHNDFSDELIFDLYGIDCGLYGHIHRDRGFPGEMPYNIATNNLCDGTRAMRLVRVTDGAILPTQSIRAGWSGQNLRITYDHPNDGSQTSNSATVVNTHDGYDFEHGLVKFHVRADSIPYAAEGGELLQTIVDGDVATCYVGVNMVYGTTTVTLEPTTWVPDGSFALIRQSRPNPARSGTTVEYVLAYASDVRLAVYDVAGRCVATLTEGPRAAGPNVAEWDLRDSDGNDVASGVYFCRLEAGDEALTTKLVVLK